MSLVNDSELKIDMVVNGLAAACVCVSVCGGIVSKILYMCICSGSIDVCVVSQPRTVVVYDLFDFHLFVDAIRHVPVSVYTKRLVL